jgi:hypothetical protein
MMAGPNAAGARGRARSLLGCASIAVLVLLVPGDECAAQAGSTASKPRTADPTYFETGIGNVALLDPNSGEQFLNINGIGTTSDDGFLQTFYSNASGSQILDLVRHPGDVRYSFSEASIFLSDGFPLGAPELTAKAFVSSKGVKPGLRPTDVRRILGKPWRITKGKEGRLTYRYFCDDSARCPSLAKYKTPSYSATVIFERGRLVQYSFGYDYP